MCQGDFELDDMPAADRSESVPMMAGEPITVQPGWKSDSSQPIIVQPRSGGDCSGKPPGDAVGAVWSVSVLYDYILYPER